MLVEGFDLAIRLDAKADSQIRALMADLTGDFLFELPQSGFGDCAPSQGISPSPPPLVSLV
ncbi:MAG: hypothetical protein WCA35_24695 [Kovacikia sp.]